MVFSSVTLQCVSDLRCILWRWFLGGNLLLIKCMLGLYQGCENQIKVCTKGVQKVPCTFIFLLERVKEGGIVTDRV